MTEVEQPPATVSAFALTVAGGAFDDFWAKTARRLYGKMNMRSRKELLSLVRERAAQRILYLPHAAKQMMRPDRMISPFEIRGVIDGGEIIEDYPDDVRGHSCLMLGRGDAERPLHVVCAPKEDYLGIITAYIPTVENWEEGFSVRVRK